MPPLGWKVSASEPLESIEDSEHESTTDSEELESTADSIPPCEKCGKWDTSELCSCTLDDLFKALLHLVKVKGLSMKKFVAVLNDLNFAEKKEKAAYFVSLSVDSQMSYIEENYVL